MFEKIQSGQRGAPESESIVAIDIFVEGGSQMGDAQKCLVGFKLFSLSSCQIAGVESGDEAIDLPRRAQGPPLPAIMRRKPLEIAKKQSIVTPNHQNDHLFDTSLLAQLPCQPYHAVSLKNFGGLIGKVHTKYWQCKFVVLQTG